MTNNTKLIITRVIVKKDGNAVYDQIFHTGINVIRGDNSTGKSTIMDLISYGLGADIKKQHWKMEALLCDEIIIELKLNGKVHVFKRAIEGESKKPPIHIRSGSYGDEINSLDGWNVYGYQKVGDRASFATRIFDLLGFEQHVTADNDNLTMHQIFRLLYADQDTPASNIFRWESLNYDRESMRTAIGEYLFGFDNLEAHILRQNLFELKKKFEKQNEDLLAIYRILGRTNINANTKEIHNEILKLNEDLTEIEKRRVEIKNNSVGSDSEDLSKEAIFINRQIENVSLEISNLEQKITSISYDINETEEFLKTLDFRKLSLKNAQVTVNALGVINFEYCPSCLVKLESSDDQKYHCALCKSFVDEKKVNESYLQALDQIDFQYSESKKLIELHKVDKARLIASVNSNMDLLSKLKNRFREINTYSDDYELNISNLWIEKGYIESQINALKDKLELAAELDVAIEEKQVLQNSINTLEDELKKIEFSRTRRRRNVLDKISALVVDILSKDTGVEKCFRYAEKFELDFGQNIMLLDGRANFSASSNVVLKNAFHLATLIVACDDDDFRIPCFAMMDNIEDKGMTELRSKNFQRVVIEFNSKIKTDYQLIMTTSMVDESLNNDVYGVGPFYKSGEYTLNV